MEPHWWLLWLFLGVYASLGLKDVRDIHRLEEPERTRRWSEYPLAGRVIVVVAWFVLLLSWDSLR